MTFLSPFLLWVILPFVIMPVIIHLINRMRYTPLKWAAMDFLFSAKRSSTKFAKLREKIILACRCFAILCLALALSRPRSGGWMGWSFSNSAETVIIVLDRSNSMGALDESGEKNKLQRTIQMVRESAALLPRGTRFVLIDSATAKATTLQDLETLDDPLLFGVTDATCNMSELLQITYDYIKTNVSGEAEVWMTGDLQYSNWNPENRQWQALTGDFSDLNQKINFRMLALSHKVKENTSVSVRSATRTRYQEKNVLNLKLHLERNFEKDEVIQLSVKLNGNTTLRELRISGRVLDYTYTIDLPEGDKGGFGVVSIPKDKQPGDDSYYFAYGESKELKSGVISKSSFSKLLVAAASPVKGTNHKAQLISATQLPSILSKNYSLIIVEDSNLNQDQQRQLLSFVQQGGQVLIFPPIREGQEMLSAIKPGKVESSAEAPFVVDNWDSEQGALANSTQGEALPLNKLNISSRQLPLNAGEVLASYKDGGSFLSRYGRGKGAIYYCSSGIQKKWSDLYRGAVLLPMINRLITDGAKQYSSVINDNCQVREFSDLKTLEGNTQAIYKNLSAGVYEQDNELLVLNRPLLESTTQQITEKKLKNLFASSHFSMFNEEVASSGDENVQTELFSLFACLILIFLGVEGYMTLRKAQPGEEK